MANPKENKLIAKFMNRDMNLLDESDFVTVDFLKKTTNVTPSTAHRLFNRDCCWVIEIEVAHYPKDGAEFYNPKAKTFAMANANIDQLIYVHEGMLNQVEATVMAAKIFRAYIEENTMILYAKAIMKPMELSNYLKAYGPFKQLVTPATEVNIDYQIDPLIPENYLTIAQMQPGAAA